MKFNLRNVSDTCAELTIESDSTKITTDIAAYHGLLKRWVIDENIIDQFITIANDCSRFNRKSDVDFVKKIYDSLLNDAEKQEFLNEITQEECQ